MAIYLLFSLSSQFFFLFFFFLFQTFGILSEGFRNYYLIFEYIIKIDIDIVRGEFFLLNLIWTKFQSNKKNFKWLNDQNKTRKKNVFLIVEFDFL